MKLDVGIRVMTLGLAASFLGTVGCATYSPVSRRYSEFGSGLRADLPKGWLRFNPAKDGCTITRDGLRLERVTLRTHRVGKKIEGTDRVYSAGMMPYEAADLSVGLLKAQPDVKGFEVQEIDATRVAGQEGYQIDARYVDGAGLGKRLRICGAMAGKYVYELVYEAAEAVYFQKYERVFEGIVSSVRIAR